MGSRTQWSGGQRGVARGAHFLPELWQNSRRKERVAGASGMHWPRRRGPVRAWAPRPPVSSEDPDTFLAACILAALTVALKGGVRRATSERKGLLREMGPRPSVRGVPDAVVNFFTLIAIRFTGDSRNVFIHHRWFGKMIN